jgi:peptidyl-prolyl cis-trans isomerase C
MKTFAFLAFACLGAAWAQAPQPTAPPPALPDLPDTEVVAKFADGSDFTMGDFKRLLQILPSDNKQLALRNRRVFVEQWGFMRYLAGLGEKRGLDKQSPAREQMDYNRMMILSQAELNDALTTLVVDGAEIPKYYEAHKDEYKQVRVKALYVAFGGTPPAGKTPLTEEQAQAKATRLLTEIRGGADFVKLVKENSDDETSRGKDGDFATLRPRDNVPDAIRTAVFSLKAGAVTEPVRQPNGYYLLRAEEVTYRPVEQARDEIYQELKQGHFKEWLDRENQASKVEFTNGVFSGDSVTIPLNLPPPPAKQP